MLRRVLILSAAVCALLLIPGAPQANAQQTAKDNPIAPRFKGSTVLSYKTTDNDDIHLPEGKIVDVDNYTPTLEPLEGKITKYRYSMPDAATTQDVSQFYLGNLQKTGFRILFQCSGNDCRADKSFEGNSRTDSTGTWCFDCAQPMQYLAAHKTTSDGSEIYAAVTVEKDPKQGGIWLTIVEVTPEAAAPAFLNAAAFAKQLAETGHSAVYGIYFDPGSAELGPEAEPTLAEIATLLTNDPTLKLRIVGHTDNAGTALKNVALSKRRAAAVTARLISHYHIAATRLQSDGVGPADPVALNTTKDGRAKNTRLELVKQQ
jgi:OmpA-OmpF porin, OOP family